MISNTSRTIVLLALSMCACSACNEDRAGRSRPPDRLSPISQNATWAGGVDGGSWIECDYIISEDANWCTVWSDQTGEVMARTYFVSRDSGKGIADAPLAYASFDGVWIRLKNGRILVPRKFHGQERDLWEPTPIDPPRVGL